MSEPRGTSTQLAAEADAVLRRRAEALARKVEQDTIEPRTGLLVFQVGAHWYAVHVEGVREILHHVEVTPVPCVPDFVRGVVSIRGEIVSVTDCARRLGIAGAGTTSAPVAIVLENEESATALVVDQVGGIIDVPASGVEPPLPHIDQTQAAFVTATVFLGDRLVSLVNVDRILQPIGAGAP